MPPNLPSISWYKNIERYINKFGWTKFLLLSFFYIAISVISNYFNNSFFIKSKLNELESRIDTKIETKVENRFNLQFNTGNPPEANHKLDEDKSESKNNILGSASFVGDFNPDQWILGGYFRLDDENYWCPSRKGFPYWSMWVKEKMPFDFKELSIIFQLKGRQNGSLAPLIVSIGEYDELEHLERASPKVYYRIILFDGDKRTIRLYDSYGKKIAEDRLKEDPNFNSPMNLKINQRISNPNDNKVFLTPELSYNPPDLNKKTIYFQPQEDFVLRVPLIDLETEGVKTKIGIGVYDGDCIKITDVKIGKIK